VYQSSTLTRSCFAATYSRIRAFIRPSGQSRLSRVPRSHRARSIDTSRLVLPHPPITHARPLQSPRVASDRFPAFDTARVSLRRRTAFAPCTSTSHASHKNTSTPNDTTHDTRSHRQSTLGSPSRTRRRVPTAIPFPIAASESASSRTRRIRLFPCDSSRSAFHTRIHVHMHIHIHTHTHRPPYKTPPPRARDTPRTSASNPRPPNRRSIASRASTSPRRTGASKGLL